jgi:hypothetical protein
MCGKIKYDSMADANLAISKIKHRRQHTKRFEHKVYFCRMCKAYHLTSWVIRRKYEVQDSN